MWSNRIDMWIPRRCKHGPHVTLQVGPGNAHTIGAEARCPKCQALLVRSVARVEPQSREETK